MICMLKDSGRDSMRESIVDLMKGMVINMDIFVIGMCVVAGIVGVWVWLMESGRIGKKDDDSEKK